MGQVAAGIDLSETNLLIAVANTGHDVSDELADIEAVSAWWASITGADVPPATTSVSVRGVERLRTLRSLIRRLAWGNNGIQLEPESAEEALFASLPLRPFVTGTKVGLRPAKATAAPIDVITAAGISALIHVTARPDWPRLKACRALDCGWVFVDGSRNMSRRWCDMGDCGNRAKGAAFRSRARQGRRTQQSAH
uniref:CGNR zinc finger domain-containing protein n=1 Tax=Paractinoplanes polyasparticus TaxID=2856853 RepID=UPI001C862E8D|nr:CGNR zinc finger domain-containing protein [Actinoplanes polyasparticus]